MATQATQALNTPPAGVAAAEDTHPPVSSEGTDCYLRMGFTAIEHRGSGFHLHCLACSWSEDAPVCAIAIRLARAHARQNPVGSAGHPDSPVASPAQVAAARNYVRRIPDLAQQAYAEEHLAWTLAGKPKGCHPLLRCFGLGLTAGEQLAATIERLLGLAPVRPSRRKRR
jgi:hypothetical protein